MGVVNQLVKLAAKLRVLGNLVKEHINKLIYCSKFRIETLLSPRDTLSKCIDYYFGHM